MPVERTPLYRGKEWMTIKEFSAFSGIEQTTLRYWDEIGLFSPASRNEENNYRYYSPMQIGTVKFISVLSGLGMPLRQIGTLEDERTPETIIALIERQENLLDREMSRLRDAYSLIHRLRELIKLGMDADPGEITVEHAEDTHYILGPRNEWGDEPSFFETFIEFCKQAPPLRINLSYPVGGLHASMEAFLHEPSRPEYYFSVDPAGYSKRPAGEYLIAHTRGYYGEFGDMPQRMAAYLREHSLKADGPVYVVYIHDEICMREQDRYLARLSVAVKKAEEPRPEWRTVEGIAGT